LKHQTALATHFLHLIGLAEVQDEKEWEKVISEMIIFLVN